MKVKFVHFCLLFTIGNVELIASSNLSYWKYFFDRQTGNLQCFEGIYKTELKIENSSPELFNSAGLTNCTTRNFQQSNFDTICIYKADNNFVVFSFRFNKEIGKLRVQKSINEYWMPKNKYFEGIRLFFEGNGSKIYNSNDDELNISNHVSRENSSSNISFNLNHFRFHYRDRYDFLTSDLAAKITYNCASESQYNEVGSQFNLTNESTRFYPNSNEVPKISNISSGTGVNISNNGLILTNYHVVKDLNSNLIWREEIEKEVKYKIYNWVQLDKFDSENHINYCSDSIICIVDNKKYLVQVLDANEKNDWAILKIKDPKFFTENFAILDTSEMQLGTEVYTLGFPITEFFGTDIKFTNGYISSNKQLSRYAVNMSINPGNSGGGMYNKTNGQLIGLTTSRFNDNSIGIKVEGVSFSIKLNQIATTLKNNDVFERRVMIKENKFNPSISIERNSRATVQVVSY